MVFVRGPAWCWVGCALRGSFRKPGQLVRGSGHTCVELGVSPRPEWTCGQSVQGGVRQADDTFQAGKKLGG